MDHRGRQAEWLDRRKIDTCEGVLAMLKLEVGFLVRGKGHFFPVMMMMREAVM